MKNLPTITELYKGSELQKNENKLNVLLNQPPKKEWIKTHPFAKGVEYLPIERVEWLLTNLYIKWKVEVREVKLIANSAVVTVRLHYKDVITEEWDWQDGVGAAPLQTEKGAGATDFNKVRTDAVMKAAPAAESFAEKNAAKKLGRIFGKDLNRADELNYDSLAGKFDKSEVDILKEKVLTKFAEMDETPELLELQKLCSEKLNAGEFTVEFAKNILSQL